MAEEITVIGIGVDTTQVNKAADDLDRLAAAGKRTETAADGVSASVGKIDSAAAGAGRAVSAIAAATDGTAKALERTQTAASALAGGLGAIESKASSTASSLGSIGSTAAAAVSGVDAIGAASARAATASKALAVDFDKIGTSLGASSFSGAEKIDKYGDALQALAYEAKFASVELDGIGTYLGAAANKAAQAEAQLKALTASTNSAGIALAGIVRSGDAAAASMAKTDAASKALSVDLDKVGTALGASGFKGVAELDKLGTSLGAASGEAQKFTGFIKQIDTSALEKAGLALGAASAGVQKVAAASAVAGNAIKPAAEGVKALGEATKLTANQSQQLAFQLQDFFVQVQAGQSPLTALIQQGSQLQGTFGSIGGVFRALGTVFTPVRIAIGGVVGAIAGLAIAYKQGADESTALTQSLILTSNAAGITEGRFNSLAASVAGATKTSIGSARETLQSLVSSGQLSGATLEKVFTAVQAGSKVTGQSADELAKQFVGALDNVGAFAEKLNKTYNVLSADQLKLIKDTADNGDAQKALGIVMDAINPKFAEAAGKAGLLTRAYADLSNAASSLLDGLKSIGRDSTPEEALKAVNAQLAELKRNGQARYVFGPSASELQVQAQALKDQVGYQNAAAAASAKTAATEDAKTKFYALQEQTLGKSARYAKEIAAANSIADKAGVSADQRTALLKQIIDKYREAGSAAKTAQSVFADLDREMSSQLETMNARIANGSELSKSQELELRLNQRLADSVGKLSKAELDRLQTKARELVAAQKTIENQAIELKAAEQIAQARADIRRAEDKAIADTIAQQEKERDASLKSVADRLQGLKDEEAALLQSRALNISLAEAVELVALARLEEQQARYTEDSDAYKAIQKEIDARKELAGLIGTKSAREANEKAAKDALDTWQKTTDQIGQSLTDALMQGGKSAWEYIKGLFRSTVLRPIIQAVVSPVTGAVTSALGISSPSQAGNALSAINGGSSVISAITGGLTSSIAGIVSSAGSLLGSTALTTFATGIKGGTLAAGLAGPTTAGAGGALGAGAAFASAIPYIAGALALFSVKDSLFGRKLQDTSITGTLGGDAGFAGSTEKFFKGGLFRSNKTTTEALSADVSDPIAASANAIREQVTAYAEALNLPVDAIASYAEAIKFSTKGLSEEQIAQKLQDALTGFGENLAGTLSAQVDPFAKAGEDTSTTLSRLASAIKAVNPIIEQLGFSLFDVSASGADAASQLADLFGGSDGFAQAASNFYQKFYSETERAQKLTEAVTATLGGVGLALPDTREQFRALVEAQDLTTESGRQTFAALLSVSDAFDQLETASGDVASSAAETAQRLKELQQGLADAISANIGKFQTPEQRTQSAYEGVAGSLSAVGVTLDIGTLMNATKDDILAFAEAFIGASENSLEAKTAVATAAGALADLKDAADESAKAVAAAAAELQGRLVDAITANVGAFQTVEQRRQFQGAAIQTNLAAVGINFDLETLLGASKADILAYAQAVLLSADYSTEAKIAVVEAAGALAEMADAATIAARDLEAAGIQSQIDEITRVFGDLSVINDPVKTLSQTFVETRDSIKSLETGLDELLGNTSRTIQQTLADLLTSQRALQGYRSTLATTIEDARLRTLSPEDRVASLKATESSLFSQLQTAADPVAVAQKLTAVTLQRIKEEAGIKQQASDAAIEAARLQVTLAEQARNAQIDLLRSQIDGFNALKDLADNLAQFTSSLKIGDLSPLSAERQLSTAQSLFDSTVSGALAGDPSAVGNVQGNAQTLLEEARRFYGGSTAEYAAIFNDVLGQLDTLGVAGANVDPQIAALESQLAQLEALNVTTQTVVDTSREELQALTAIDAALSLREQSNAVAIDKQIGLAQAQIDQLILVRDDLAAQITQQAAIAEGLNERLEEIRDLAQATLDNTTLEGARP